MKDKLFTMNIISGIYSYTLGALCLHFILFDSFSSYSLDDSNNSSESTIFIIFCIIALISLYFYHSSIHSLYDNTHSVIGSIAVNLFFFIVGIFPFNPIFLCTIYFSINYVIILLPVIALYVYGIYLANNKSKSSDNTVSEEQ